MQLITERLVLRDFVETDWQEVLAYQSDPRYLRYYAWEGRSPSEVQAFVDRFITWQNEQPRTNYQLAVVDKTSGRLIGNCGVRKPAPDALAAELGYELAPDHWGHGYATEAARALIAFGFNDLRLQRISAHCIAENVASVRVLQRLGMQQEARLSDKESFKGRSWDVLVFALPACRVASVRIDRRFKERRHPRPPLPPFAQCSILSRSRETAILWPNSPSE